MSPQSKNLFKMQAFLMVTKGLICGQKKKKKISRDDFDSAWFL